MFMGGGGGRFSLRLRFQARGSILPPPGWKGIACGFMSFISAVVSRRPAAVLSRLVSGSTTGTSWGVYRGAGATADIEQTEERTSRNR